MKWIIAGIFVGCYFILAPFVLADDGVWDRISNPYKIGTVEEISIGYDGLTQYIFAATSSDSCFLWMTTDQGQNWLRSNRVEGHGHTRVVIEAESFRFGWTLVPSNAGNTDPDAGPYRTADFGNSWQLRDNDLENAKKLHALAADQTSIDLQTAFVGAEGDTSNGYKRLLKTTDGGTNWQRAENGLPQNEEGTVYDIAICADYPQYMYCAYDGETGSGIYRSQNGGGNWERISTLDFISVMAVTVHPTVPNLAAVVEKTPVSGRVYVSENATGPSPTWDVRTCAGSGFESKCIRFESYYSSSGDKYHGWVAFNSMDSEGNYAGAVQFRGSPG